MSTISVWMNHQKTNRNGESIVYIIYRSNDQKTKFSTGEKGLSSEWNPRLKRFRTKTPLNIKRNQTIDSAENFIKQIVTEIRESENINHPSVTSVKELYNLKKNGNKHYFTEMHNAFLEHSRMSTAAGTQKVYRLFFNSIRDFVGPDRVNFLRVSEINNNFLDKYIKHLIDKGNSNDTISWKTTHLKQFLDFCENKGCKVHKLKKISLKKTTKRDVIFLTESEVYAFEQAPLKKNSQQKYKDFFLFSCYTGLRWSDIRTLSPNEIVVKHGQKCIKKINKKPGKFVVTPLSQKADNILQNYKENAEQTGFFFPFFSKEFLNKHIKKIAKAAGINSIVVKKKRVGGELIVKEYEKWQILSIHKGRHTALTHFQNATGDIFLTSRLAGHASIVTTQKYYLGNDDKATIEKMEKAGLL